MKFEDAYRRSNDAVHVRESLRDEIARDYAKEKVQKSTANRKRWLAAIPVTAAAAAAVFVAVAVGVQRNGRTAAPKAADALYMEAVEAAEPMEAYDGAPGEMNGLLYAGAADAAPEEAPDDTASLMPKNEALTQGVTQNDVTSAPLATDDEGALERDSFDLKTTVTASDVAATDGTWTYTLHLADHAVGIAAEEGTVTATIDLKSENHEDSYSAATLLPVDDLLFVFGTFEAAAETENPVTTVISVYALGDRSTVTFVSRLTQRGTFTGAKCFDGRIMTTSTYSVQNAESGKQENYTLLTEIDANVPTAFASERTVKTK